MVEFLQLIATGIMVGGLYATVAAAIVLVYKSTHIVSLAHGQIMGFGALTFYFGLVALKLPFRFGFCNGSEFRSTAGLVHRTLRYEAPDRSISLRFISEYLRHLPIDGWGLSIDPERGLPKLFISFAHRYALNRQGSFFCYTTCQSWGSITVVHCPSLFL